MHAARRLLNDRLIAFGCGGGRCRFIRGFSRCRRVGRGAFRLRPMPATTTPAATAMRIVCKM